MTQLYPIVLETEDSGAVSAYVPGLPVYAAADTCTKANEPFVRCWRHILRRTRIVAPARPDGLRNGRG